MAGRPAVEHEPDVKLFRMGSGTWKTGEEWPLPETKWTPFYLHQDGMLSERDHFPNDGFDTLEDSPFGRGELAYYTPPLVERTEVLGPTVLRLFAETTDDEVLFFVTLLDRDPDGNETELTKGWLRGSQRREDPECSEPWSIHHPHNEREPVVPGEVAEYAINVLPTGRVFRPGHRIGVRIECADVPEGTSDYPHAGIRDAFSRGRHLSRQSASRVSLYHDEERPSRLLLPITDGNVMGTFWSGGEPASVAERVP